MALVPKSQQIWLAMGAKWVPKPVFVIDKMVQIAVFFATFAFSAVVPLWCCGGAAGVPSRCGLLPSLVPKQPPKGALLWQISLAFRV